MTWVAAVWAAIAVTAVAMCVPSIADPLAEWRHWRSEVQAAHPLAGRVTNGAGHPIELTGDAILPPDGLTSAFLLLGEVHDNPAHPKIRAWIIESLLAGGSGRRPALVFEHIRADQQASVDRIVADRKSATIKALFSALEWDKSGWAPPDIFAPLFGLALEHNLSIRAGDASRGDIRNVARGGLAVLSDGERNRLGLRGLLEPPLQNALLDELEASHCGLMTKASLAGLAVAQLYRDAHLASAMSEGGGQRGMAVLLAGNGHVRTDRGVPWHLRRKSPGSRQASVMLLEVEDGKTDAALYVPRSPDGGPATDYVIFTPRAIRSDPCNEMRERFRK